MTSSARPRLVVAVANGITGDSRVQKSAIAAARDGWEVFLIGAGTGREVKRTAMGPIQVIRVPIPTTARDTTGRRPFRQWATGFRLRDKAAITRYQATYQRRNACGLAAIRWIAGSGARRRAVKLIGWPIRKGLALGLRCHTLWYRTRLRLLNWGKQSQQSVMPTGDWRVDGPVLVDLDLAFVPLIEELKPDLLHANDITMIGSAAQAVSRMRSRGEQVRWIYDAHEYVRGVDWPTPHATSSYCALEAEFIRQADAVVTVAPEIAGLIADHYGLERLPTVVRNTPLREVPDTGQTRPSVRAACGLPDDTKLLVYSGWISAERGLPTVIEALPQLPDCHFAIVAGRPTPVLDAVLKLAVDQGVRDRVHVVPYVPQHLVPAYLSTADAGIICSKRSLNYENSLPTKLAEYLHAGLPVVVNDLRVLSEFIRQHDVGEVFCEDVNDFVEAVKRVLKRHDELVDNITEPMLRELSWEQQSAALLTAYRETSLVVPQVMKGTVPWTVQETERAVQSVRSPLPPWRPMTTTQVRLGVGPANYAGQAAAFAQAICRDYSQVSAEVMMIKANKATKYPADIYMSIGQQHGVTVQIEQLRRVVGRYTHLIADAFLPIFGASGGNSINKDLPILKRSGIKVALLAHGSEVRHPAHHLARHACSLFHDASADLVEVLTQTTEMNRRIAESCGLPLFVTTPDLLDDLPGARWAPLVVDVDAWASDHPIMERDRPVVLHAPSARWSKGTERVLPLLTELESRGVIELQLVEGVPWSEMCELVKQADIVLDQFGTGSYGTFAVEAMAAGRPVVAYLGDNVTEVIGAKPPIVNATADTLVDALMTLLEDPDRTRQLGAESVAFAHEHHDGRRTARVFEDFLIS